MEGERRHDEWPRRNDSVKNPFTYPHNEHRVVWATLGPRVLSDWLLHLESDGRGPVWGQYTQVLSERHQRKLIALAKAKRWPIF
jgi:hypothetical protein